MTILSMYDVGRGELPECFTDEHVAFINARLNDLGVIGWHYEIGYGREERPFVESFTIVAVNFTVRYSGSTMLLIRDRINLGRIT